MAYKLRMDPTDEHSATYEHNISYFRDGTAEALLSFLRDIYKVIQGQAINEPTLQFTLMRKCLLGDALAAFDNAANSLEEETQENFELCKQRLIEHVLPKKALITQKRYMRRFLRKPMEVTVRDFMTRMEEINSLMERFPPFQPNQQLPHDEIMDIAEYAMPVKWQKQMVIQGFDPTDSTTHDFIEFCERLETTEGETEMPNRFKHGPMEPKGRHAKSFDKRKPTRKRKFVPPQQQYCSWHEIYGHTAENCEELKRLKKMKIESRQNQQPYRPFASYPPRKDRESTYPPRNPTYQSYNSRPPANNTQDRKEQSYSIESTNRNETMTQEVEYREDNPNYEPLQDPPDMDESSVNLIEFKELGLTSDSDSILDYT